MLILNPLSHSAVPALECPTDFTWNPSVSLCYNVIETPMLWQDCKTHCEALGARLAVLDTPAKLDVLLSGVHLFIFLYFIFRVNMILMFAN